MGPHNQQRFHSLHHIHPHVRVVRLGMHLQRVDKGRVQQSQVAQTLRTHIAALCILDGRGLLILTLQGVQQQSQYLQTSMLNSAPQTPEELKLVRQFCSFVNFVWRELANFWVSSLIEKHPTLTHTF